ELTTSEFRIAVTTLRELPLNENRVSIRSQNSDVCVTRHSRRGRAESHSVGEKSYGLLSRDRVEPSADIAAGRHRPFCFVVVQIAGGVNQLVADIVIRPAETIPERRIIIDQPPSGEGRHQILQPFLGAPGLAELFLDLRGREALV